MVRWRWRSPAPVAPPVVEGNRHFNLADHVAGIYLFRHPMERGCGGALILDDRPLERIRSAELRELAKMEIDAPPFRKRAIRSCNGSLI